MSSEVNFQSWAVDMCSLLDAIEAALSDDDIEKARTLVAGRHQIARAQGLDVIWTGMQSAGIQ